MPRRKRYYTLRGPKFPLMFDERGHVQDSEMNTRDGIYDKVRENVKHIILTSPGERMFRPEFGGKFFELFRMNDPAGRQLRAKDIKEAIEQWEPHVAFEVLEVLEPTPNEQARGIAKTRLKIRIKKENVVTEMTIKNNSGSVEVDFENA